VNKLVPTIDEAVADVFDGATVGFGAFFTCGNPSYLTKALAKQGAKNLTVVAGMAGVGNTEVNLLLENNQVQKLICNYPFHRSASKKCLFEQLLIEGKVECEVYPMGTYAEKLRAAGAGIPAFYTPTGVGTYVEEGKDKKIFNGKECLLELALPLDFGFVHAWKADTMGNVVFRKTAVNFNMDTARAAKITVVEAENVVEPGELDPECIHLPGIYVDRVVKVERQKINVGI
jgi:3-oxoacid CoA-transferase subunit A